MGPRASSSLSRIFLFFIFVKFIRVPLVSKEYIVSRCTILLYIVHVLHAICVQHPFYYALPMWRRIDIWVEVAWVINSETQAFLGLSFVFWLLRQLFAYLLVPLNLFLLELWFTYVCVIRFSVWNVEVIFIN